MSAFAPSSPTPKPQFTKFKTIPLFVASAAFGIVASIAKVAVTIAAGFFAIHCSKAVI